MNSTQEKLVEYRCPTCDMRMFAPAGVKEKCWHCNGMHREDADKEAQDWMDFMHDNPGMIPIMVPVIKLY